jgi:hypothetical protein
MRATLLSTGANSQLRISATRRMRNATKPVTNVISGMNGVT